jgi:SAM-dependent methyltransferase
LPPAICRTTELVSVCEIQGLFKLPARPSALDFRTCSASILPEMTSYYARRAGEYERIYSKPERQADLQRLRDCLQRAFTGARVLEIACGTGFWTKVIAASAASVMATDVNEEVLALARAKPLPPGKVTFLRADAYSLPAFGRGAPVVGAATSQTDKILEISQPDIDAALPGPAAGRAAPFGDRFTGGLAAFWWSHVPRAKLRDFLLHFHGRLASEARVVFIDNVYVEGSSTPIARTDEHGDTFQLRKLDDGSVHEVLKNFPTENEMRGALEGMACAVQAHFLQYYWLLSYTPTPMNGA